MKKYIYFIAIGFLLILLPFLFSAEGDYTGTTYDTSSIGSSGLFSAITTNNTFIWGTDGTPLHNVYKLWQNGTYTNEYFTTSGVMTGITNNNTFFWIMSSGTISKFWMNGTNTTEMFTPDSGYSCSRQITQNGTFFWLNCGSSGNAIRIYWMNGTYYGTFAVNSEVAQGRGIYTNSVYIWITDDTTDKVYRYYMNGTYNEQNWDTAGSGNIGPKSLTMDNTYFYLTDTVNKTIFLYYGYPDIISPTFTTIPNNSSLFYPNNLSVDFDATDNIAFGYYSINDSRFKIFQNGTLLNNLILGIGNYEINVTINDTSNNIAWTRYTLEINKSLEQCQVLYNETSPLEYTNTFLVWANCTSAFVLTRNGTTILNNSEQSLGVSAYNFSLQRNDTANYTYIFNESQFIVTDTTKPVLTIINPIDGESFTSGTIDLNFSVTDNGIGLDMCWYQNHTGNQTINCSLNTTISQSVDGTYTIYMFANDTYGNLATDSHTWTLSANAPAVNLNYPPIANYFNTNNTLFNFTATDTNGIDTCQLWINSTGTWHKNQTLTSVTSGVQTSFNSLNFTDNYYIWNVFCNDSTGLPGTSAWATLNRSFIIDTTNPNITINSITTTAGSQTISFNSTENDTNLNSCKYSIYNSSGMIDGTNENVSMVCNTNPHSATVTAYGVYVLRVYGLDLAGNEDYSELAFITSASTGTTVSGGGGGGGDGITREKSQVFEITSLNYLDKLDISLAKDSVRPRTKNFYITNKGSLPVTLIISCESVNSSICDYVEIPEKTIVVSPNENEPYLGTLTLLTPENSSIGDAYYFNILATSTEEGTEYYSKLSVSSKVSFLAYIYKYSYLFKTEKTFLVTLPSLFFSILLFIFTLRFFGKRKMEVAGFFLSVIILLTSFFLGLILM